MVVLHILDIRSSTNGFGRRVPAKSDKCIRFEKAIVCRRWMFELVRDVLVRVDSLGTSGRGCGASKTCRSGGSRGMAKGFRLAAPFAYERGEGKRSASVEKVGTNFFEKQNCDESSMFIVQKKTPNTLSCGNGKGEFDCGLQEIVFGRKEKREIKEGMFGRVGTVEEDMKGA